MSSQTDPDWAQVARGPQAFEGQPKGPDEVPEEVADDEVEEVHELNEPLPDEGDKTS